MRYEGEGGVVFDGGSWGASGKRRVGMVYFALLAAIFAFVLLSDPAWAQDNSSGDLVGAPVEEERDNDGFIDVIRIFEEDCQVVEDGATITFEVSGGTFDDELVTVVDGSNVQIEERSGQLVVRDIQGSGDTDDNIEFLTDEGLQDVNGGLEVVASTGIECADGIGDGDGDGDSPGDGPNDGPFDDNDFDGEDDFDDEDNEEDFDDEDDEEDLADAEEDLNESEATIGDDDLDDAGDDDGGVSATADGDGAEASTPGAVASAGQDPDELNPVTDPLGDVEDEIPTSGPLPNTGGMSVLAVILPLAGFLLLCVSIIHRVKRNR